MRQALKPARPKIITWRDSLGWGPVPAGLSLAELSRVRSGFWTGKPGAFEKRDAALARFGEHNEVVLCFGSTVLCQLALVQLLDWFSRQDLGGTTLSLVTAYGGVLQSNQFLKAIAEKQPISTAQLRLARQVWAAYRAPSPLRFQALLSRDLRALPEIRHAIVFLLQEYPEAHDGLSRLQRKLLSQAASLSATLPAWIVGHMLGWETVGDVSLFHLLKGMAGAHHPLLSREPATGDFRAATLTVTPLARQMLAGKADHVALNGIDRWIGGVHLERRRVKWRWDERSQRIY